MLPAAGDQRQDEQTRRGGTSNIDKLVDAFKGNRQSSACDIYGGSRQYKGHPSWPLFLLWRLQRPALLEHNYESQQRPLKDSNKDLFSGHCCSGMEARFSIECCKDNSITALSVPHILYHDWQSRDLAVAHSIPPIILAFGNSTRVIHIWKQRNTRCRSPGNGTRL